MKITCAGGSSSVFKKRVEGRHRKHVHLVDDVHAVFGAVAGVKLDSSIRARMLSTPLLLAASISTTSRIRPVVEAAADRAALAARVAVLRDPGS